MMMIIINAIKVYSRVYLRVLTRVDLNSDYNPAIEVGWVNPG
jgi:hypothetical protein